MPVVKYEIKIMFIKFWRQKFLKFLIHHIWIIKKMHLSSLLFSKNVPFNVLV